MLFVVLFCLTSVTGDTLDHAVCRKVEHLSLPLADQPTLREKALLHDCDARALYYGFGQAVDFKRARQCAYIQFQGGDGFFEGPQILMMIYANGLGVARNISLAEKFACMGSGLDRVEHLEQLRKNPKVELFDFCDDASVTPELVWCTDIHELFEIERRNRTLTNISSRWTDRERTAFNKLQQASEQFAKLRGEQEVDLSGTGHFLWMMNEIAIQREDFLQSVQKLEANQAPKYSSSQLTEEDSKLNTLYRIILKKKDFEPQAEFNLVRSTVNRVGIQAAQRAWLKYRDAWVEFAALKYPSYPGHSIAAWFTKKRNYMLQYIITHGAGGPSLA
eukprot:gb/GEZN01008541.1/.p1 GENE.gb/GEZN01008541.1/~~gb/GEZN01008541.1/.p1  ORF type:complete len:333 (-),score=32.44 gb/GEZN01008541.1/:135-1133(-)